MYEDSMSWVSIQSFCSIYWDNGFIMKTVHYVDLAELQSGSSNTLVITASSYLNDSWHHFACIETASLLVWRKLRASYIKLGSN